MKAKRTKGPPAKNQRQDNEKAKKAKDVHLKPKPRDPKKNIHKKKTKTPKHQQRQKAYTKDQSQDTKTTKKVKGMHQKPKPRHHKKTHKIQRAFYQKPKPGHQNTNKTLEKHKETKGMQEIKGADVAVQESGETQFYRRTDHLMQKALAEAHFEDPDQLADDKKNLRMALNQHCRQIFEEQTSPYLNDPQLIKTMAIARRTLLKHLKALEPEL